MLLDHRLTLETSLHRQMEYVFAYLAGLIMNYLLHSGDLDECQKCTACTPPMTYTIIIESYFCNGFAPSNGTPVFTNQECSWEY